jgi:hypothetical protein
MKFPPLNVALVFAGLLAAPVCLTAQPAPAPAPAPAPLGPRMTFLTNEYRFGRVNMGEQVNHVFVVSNSGDETLVISNVAPGCHCTTARPWTRQVPPGKTGEIPIKFDSGGIHGDVTRTITVTSNGKIAPIQTLFLRGTVWREIEVNPQTAYMTIMPNSTESSSAVVRIVNQADAPVALSDPTSATQTFKGSLKTIVPGKEFELTVTALPPLPAGNNVGTISIKTTSKSMPVVTVTALAMVQPSIGVVPMQIYLPADVRGWTTNRVIITNNGKKPLALSDLQVCCDKTIKAEIQELNPGRVFHLVLSFPPGFRLMPGQRAQVSVKSNNPERPLITVPVSQFPRQPAMVPAYARPRVMSQPVPVPAFQAAGHP